MSNALDNSLKVWSIPLQNGNAGKYLSTDGLDTTVMTWSTVDALPSQTGNAGKFLTTDGSTASWAFTGASGGGSDQVFYENDQTVTTSYTITTGTNAMTTGDITINTGVTVTVPTDSRWVIL